jgi:hypothetical protein
MNQASCEVKNPGVVEIDHPERFNRVFVISDVHGMYNPLIKLLKSAKVIDSAMRWRAEKSLLIVIGDSIDKGPQSFDVVNLWITLAEQARAAGGMLIHLLGNHEAELLAASRSGKKVADLAAELHAKGTSIDQWINPQSRSGSFFRSMPLAARVGDWLFAHAGLYPDMKWADFKEEAAMDLQSQDYSASLITSKSSVIEAKKWEQNPALRRQVESSMSANGIRGVVFGHQPAALNVVGASAISHDGRIIKVDNGMAPDAGSHPGTLLEFSSPIDLSRPGVPAIRVLDSNGETVSLQTEQSLLTRSSNHAVDDDEE